MSVLVVGSIALDTIKTPRGKKDKLLGGSATHFSLAARILSKVRMVGVVGNDFPEKYLKYLRKRKCRIYGCSYGWKD